MHEIKSTNLSHVGYENGTLKIRFKSGAEYHYTDVPPEVHAELLKAESPGGYFRTHIKEQYEWKKRGEDER
jgi:hypothetical protein